MRRYGPKIPQHRRRIRQGRRVPARIVFRSGRSLDTPLTARKLPGRRRGRQCAQQRGRQQWRRGARAPSVQRRSRVGDASRRGDGCTCPLGNCSRFGSARALSRGLWPPVWRRRLGAETGRERGDACSCSLAVACSGNCTTRVRLSENVASAPLVCTLSFWKAYYRLITPLTAIDPVDP
jgi:hypothetical protein